VLALLALGSAFTFGVPEPRGCGGAAECPALVETPARAPTAATRPPTVIYLNRGGAVLRGGNDDAAAGASSVVAECGRPEAALPPAPLDDATWAEVVACVRAEFSRFNVKVVDQRPEQAGYVMVLFGGTGDELGFGPDIRGKAPLDWQGCQTVDGAVVFVFSGKLGALAQPHCEVAAQEIAHVFTVDHELLAADAASYLPFSGTKTFQDLDAPCGEQKERPCICGRRSQNSVQLLLSKLGRASTVDTTPPTITATAVSERPGYLSATVQASDPSGVSTVALTYEDAGTFVSSTCGDGQIPCVAVGSSYTFTLAGARGTASYTATAIDSAGNVAVTPRQQLSVDDSPPDATPIALAVDAHSSGGVVATRAMISSTAGEISSAVLYWTDGRGVTSRRPLCRASASASEWSLPVELARQAGARSFVVAAADSAGHTAHSPPTPVTVE
jgi:hypothetical protein